MISVDENNFPRSGRCAGVLKGGLFTYNKKLF